MPQAAGCSRAGARGSRRRGRRAGATGGWPAAGGGAKAPAPAAAPADADLLPRAAGEQGPAGRRAVGLAGQRAGLAGRLFAGLPHARLHAELGDTAAQEEGWRRQSAGASPARRAVRGGWNVAHVNTSGGRNDSGGAVAVEAAVAAVGAAAGVATVGAGAAAAGVAVVAAAGAQAVGGEGDNGGGMGGGGAAGDGRGSLLVRGAVASNGAGPLPLTRGCTAAGAASGAASAVPPASGVQRRLLESSTNPRAERLGARLARGLNGLNATFVSGEPVGVSGGVRARHTDRRELGWSGWALRCLG